jgi:hypothetical protein
VQETGTLAGPDVAPFAPYTDRWGRTHKTGNFPCFLTNIRRAPLDKPAMWAWPSGLPEGDTLHLHVVPVGGPAEAIMGRGRSPVWPENERLDYLLVRRIAENGAPSHFVSVLDAFQGDPVIRDVRLLSERPIVVEITRPDGSDEISLHLPDGPSRTTAHRPIGIRVRSHDGQQWTRDVRVGEVGDSAGPGYANGSILDVNYERNEILVRSESVDPGDFAEGRAIRIFNDMRTAMFRITQAEQEGKGIRVKLDKTALMAQLPITGLRQGKLRLGVKTPFATGHVDASAKELPDEIRGTAALTNGPNDYYYGSVLGDGTQARRVAGISNTSPAWLHLAEPAEDAALQQDYVGKVVNLWLYGVGDSVEIARVVR